MSAAEALLMDPQQRMLLECAAEALSVQSGGWVALFGGLQYYTTRDS